MYPHRIRLRGPWQCEPLAGPEPLPGPLRMTLPCRWADGGLANFAGRVRFRRRFGYPGRIDDYERVWLTCDGLTGQADISLNDQSLGNTLLSRFEYEITPLLRDRNELLIDIEAGTDGGIWGEVALEVRRTAFLRDVELILRDGRLHIDGEAAGFAERPLELYVIADRFTVAYTKVNAGERFSVVSDPLTPHNSHTIRVDLVDGAAVWYTLDRVLAAERSVEDGNG